MIKGQIIFTIGGDTCISIPGGSYYIAAGVKHGVKITEGTRVIDVFEEPDCYPVRP